MELMYVFIYYEKMSDVKWVVYYYKYIDDLNCVGVLFKCLYIINMELLFIEEQVKFYFVLIDIYILVIVENFKDVCIWFFCVFDFYLVQDFVSFIEDLI